MRYATTTLLLLLGCGGHDTRVVTHAKSIEQVPNGQSLLSAAPIGGDYRVQLTGGAAMGAGNGTGQHASTLQLATVTASGNLAVAAGPVEISLVADVGSRRGDDPPDTAAPQRYGMRFRGTPGGKTAWMGVSLEVGGRSINVAKAGSTVCEVERDELSGRWEQVRGDDQCWSNDERFGAGEIVLRPYLAATFFPTFELTEGVYLYVGAAFDSIAVGFTEELRLREFQSGHTEVREDEEDLEFELTVQAVGGVDIRLAEHIGFLATVRSQPLLAEYDLPGPIFEGAFSLRF